MGRIHYSRNAAVVFLMLFNHYCCRKVTNADGDLFWSWPSLVCRYHNDSQLSQSVKHMQKYHGTEFQLKITRIKMDDKGEYKVRAENSWGHREEVALLKVERKYKPITRPSHNTYPPVAWTET